MIDLLLQFFNLDNSVNSAEKILCRIMKPNYFKGIFRLNFNFQIKLDFKIIKFLVFPTPDFKPFMCISSPILFFVYSLVILNSTPTFTHLMYLSSNGELETYWMPYEKDCLQTFSKIQN